jgi:hypothetical protein
MFLSLRTTERGSGFISEPRSDLHGTWYEVKRLSPCQLKVMRFLLFWGDFSQTLGPVGAPPNHWHASSGNRSELKDNPDLVDTRFISGRSELTGHDIIPFQSQLQSCAQRPENLTSDTFCNVSRLTVNNRTNKSRQIEWMKSKLAPGVSHVTSTSSNNIKSGFAIEPRH